MKKISIFIVLLMSLFLSSCFKINSVATIGKDFSINEKTVVDYTMINSIGKEGFAKDTASGAVKVDKKTPCENFMEQEEKKKDKEGSKKEIYAYKEVKCKNLDENRALISFINGNVKKYISEKDGKFYFDLDKGLGGGGGDLKKESKEEIEKVIQMYKSMGLEMNYIFIFPGNIIKTDLGTFKANKLHFSVYDIMKKMGEGGLEGAVVVFEKGNSNYADIPNTSNINKYLNLKKQYLREIITTRKQLEKSKKYRKFIKKFDIILKKLSTKKIKSIYTKLSKLDLSSNKFGNKKNLLIYLRAKLGLELLNRN